MGSRDGSRQAAGEQGTVFSRLMMGWCFCLCYRAAVIWGRELKCEGAGLKPESSGLALALWHLQTLWDCGAAALAGLGRCRQGSGVAKDIDWT